MCVFVFFVFFNFMPQIFKNGCNMFCVDPNEGHKLKHNQSFSF